MQEIGKEIANPIGAQQMIEIFTWCYLIGFPFAAFCGYKIGRGVERLHGLQAKLDNNK